MKKLIYILLLLATAGAYAQSDSIRYLRLNRYGAFERRLGADSLLFHPLAVPTTTKPYRPGASRYNPVDSTLELWTGTQWVKSAGGGGGPTYQEGEGIDIDGNVINVIPDSVRVGKSLTAQLINGNWVIVFEGDETAPGPNKVYGTNTTGQRIWKPDIPTNLSITPSATIATILNSNGTSVTIPNASSTVAGVLTAADWNTFNGKVSVQRFLDSIAAVRAAAESGGGEGGGPETDPDYNAEKPTLVQTSLTYANPSWLTSLAFNKITGTENVILSSGSYSNPTWLTAIDNTKVTGLSALLAAKSDATHNHSVDALANVLTTGKVAGDVLTWDGTKWYDQTPYWMTQVASDARYSQLGHATDAATITSGLIPAARYGAATIPTSAINASGGSASKVLTYSNGWVDPVGLTDGDKGDVTVSSTSSVLTIDNGVITLAKMANLANNTIIGRVAGTTGVPEALTPTQVTAMLNAFSSTLKGLVPASGGGTSSFLRADGTWAAPPGAGSGSPGGSTTQVQFNSSSAFAGDSKLTWNNTTKLLSTDLLAITKSASTTGNTRFLVIPTTQSFGDYSHTITQGDVNYDGQLDAVYHWGWNINGGGGKANSAEASFHTAVESHYQRVVDAEPEFEYHWQTTNKANTITQRIFTMNIGKVTGLALSSWQMDAMHWYPSGVNRESPGFAAYMQISKTGSLTLAGTNPSVSFFGGVANFVIAPIIDGSGAVQISNYSTEATRRVEFNNSPVLFNSPIGFAGNGIPFTFNSTAAIPSTKIFSVTHMDDEAMTVLTSKQVNFYGGIHVASGDVRTSLNVGGSEDRPVMVSTNGTLLLGEAGGSGYTLPTATATTKGGVKVGSGLSIDPVTAVLSATGGGGSSQWTTSGDNISYSVTNGSVIVGAAATTYPRLFTLHNTQPGISFQRSDTEHGLMGIAGNNDYGIVGNLTNDMYIRAITGDLMLSAKSTAQITLTDTKTLISGAFEVTDAATFTSLIGSGTRMVTVSELGLLSYAAIPAASPWIESEGSGVRYNGNVVVGSTSFTAGRTFVINDATLPLFAFTANNVEKSLMGIASADNVGVVGAAAGDWFLRAVNKKILLSGDEGATPHFVVGATGALSASTLAGTGTRMVVSDANGVLSTQAIPGSGGSPAYTDITSIPAASILGRYTGSTGNGERITVGSGLNLNSSGVLSATTIEVSPYHAKQENDVITNTTSATTISTINLPDNTAGIVNMWVTGVRQSNGDAFTGMYSIRYKKVAGTVSLGTLRTLDFPTTDGGVSGSIVTVTALSGNVFIEVAPGNSNVIEWRATSAWIFKGLSL